MIGKWQFLRQQSELKFHKAFLVPTPTPPPTPHPPPVVTITVDSARQVLTRAIENLDVMQKTLHELRMLSHVTLYQLLFLW